MSELQGINYEAVIADLEAKKDTITDGYDVAASGPRIAGVSKEPVQDGEAPVK